jgi:hypothetical protein
VLASAEPDLATGRRGELADRAKAGNLRIRNANTERTTLQQGNRGGLTRIVFLTANTGCRRAVLRMSILRTRNALLLTSDGKRPGVGAIKLKE